MQKTTTTTQTSARISRELRENAMLLRQLACAAAGFLAAGASVMEAMAPFGVALCAALPRRYFPAAAAGALVGGLFAHSAGDMLKYALALLLLAALRLVVCANRKQSLGMDMVLAAVSIGGPGLILVAATGKTLYDAILCVAELLLACCSVYFFSRTISAFSLGVDNIRQRDLTAITITFCIAVLSLVGLRIGGLSVGRILAVTVILLCVQLGGEAGGAIAGVSAGLSAGILGGAPFLMCTYGFGGLLAGVFAPLGKLASAAAFILINLFVLLASDTMDGRVFLFELFLASALSVLPMPGCFGRIRAAQNPVEPVRRDVYRGLLQGRIAHMSEALRDVAQTSRKVNDKLASLTSGDVSSVCACAADQICSGCRQKSHCWQQRYGDTMDAMNGALSTLRRTGTLTAEQFPEWFLQSCPSTDRLAAQIGRLFGEYSAREGMRRKVARVRGVMTDQFEGMALLIDAMGRELATLAAQDLQAEGKIRAWLHQKGIYAVGIACMVDEHANMRVEIQLPIHKLSRLSKPELTLALSDICERAFDLPYCGDPNAEGVCELTFSEKAVFAVQWGASQIGGGASKLCGDSYSYADSRGGRVNFILSDGMGSGGAAAVDSTMTAELLKRLIEAGVSLDAALKLVNSALLVKSGDEASATIDITGIDLYTGQVEFYKAGAAPTFLCKSGKAGYVEACSLPVGILDGVSFEKSMVTMREGDWVVMMSDGAAVGGYAWILNELERFGEGDPRMLSERLATQAISHRADGHEDDVTVISIRLERGV